MTSELGVDLNIRQKGVRIIKPIIYGNVARYFGHKREDGHTHQWTVYIKPYRNEDMTAYIQKVTFKLHDSYANSLRVVTEPPYEVTETGWGEFDVIIRIYFNDTKDKPIVIVHLMKLFQSEVEILEGTKNLVIENYDELVFDDPSAIQQHLLTTQRPLTLNTYKHETDFEAIKVSQIAQLKATQKRIREEFRMLVTAIRDKYFQTVECYRKIVSIKVKEDNDRALVLKRRAAKHSKALPALTAAGEEDVDVEGNHEEDEEDVNIVDDLPTRPDGKRSAPHSTPATSAAAAQQLPPRNPPNESITDMKQRYNLDAYISARLQKHREYELAQLADNSVTSYCDGNSTALAKGSEDDEDEEEEDSEDEGQQSKKRRIDEFAEFSDLDDMDESYYENLEREYVAKHGALPAEYVALMRGGGDEPDEETASEEDGGGVVVVEGEAGAAAAGEEMGYESYDQEDDDDDDDDEEEDDDEMDDENDDDEDDDFFDEDLPVDISNTSIDETQDSQNSNVNIV